MYLFFDTETTGLPLKRDAPVTDLNNWPRLVQLAMVLYDDNGNKINEADYIVKPNGFTIPPETSVIHHITTERALAEGQDISLVLKAFEEFNKQATYLVAHNVLYDENIIGSELIRNGFNNSLVGKNKICTMQGSKEFCGIQMPYGLKPPKLSELYLKLFNTNFENAHNAQADIEATAKCFWELRRLGVI